MGKRIWDRRLRRKRRENDGNNILLPDGAKPKRVRRKGERRKRAATLLLGLSTIMPVPTAKLVHGNGGKSGKKHHIMTGSLSKNRLEFEGKNFFSGPPNLEVQLWTPPTFGDELSESDQLEMRSLHIAHGQIINVEELRPHFTYSDIVYPISTEYEVDWRLVAAVIQAESNFDPDAVSPVGARGLMQLMPETAADYGVTLKNIHDPEANIEAGVRHLKRLSRIYDGDIPLIAAAYNAGQGTVAKFEGIPPFEETRTYVERVVSYYNSFAG